MAPAAEYIDINAALVQRFKQGDEKAFAELYALYAKAMLNAAFRILNNVEEAEEVLQDSFLSVHEHIGTYDKKYTFGAWLKRIVINRSLNVLKKKKVILVSLEEQNVQIEDPIDDAHVDYDVNVVRNCIRELPDGYRTIFTLFLFEKYSHKEIAGLLNISEGTSKSQYNRAKKKLVELIKQKHGR
jgi:RNA polymerase sigma factor (sigma-70 family)